MKPKHIFKWIIGAALLVFLIFVLSQSEYYTEESVTPDTRDTIRILAAQTTENSEDSHKIVHRINEMGLDYKVDILFMPFQSWSQTTHQYFSSGEQLDIIYGSNASLFDLFGQDKIIELDGLLERYGQGILQAVDREYFKVGRYEGKQYAIPINRDMTVSYVFEFREDLAEQYGLNFDSVTTLDDLEKIFEKLVSQTDDILPLAGYQHQYWDSLGDNLGVLMNHGEEPKVENLYDTERYREYVERIYGWRNKGWVLDTLSVSMSTTAYLRSGKVLGSIGTGKPGLDIQETRSVGYPIRSVEIVSPYITTDQIGIAMWSITRNSPKPELAMDFLNRMYTDPEIYNLLTYGIENEHYVFVDEENQVIDYPAGVDASNSGYAQFLGWMYGNQYLSYIWNGNDINVWEQTRAYNDNAYRSSAMGFIFDNAAIEDVWMNCRTIQNKYADALEQGYLDPDIYLEKMKQELSEAGLDEIISEKERQLSKWLREGAE